MVGAAFDVFAGLSFELDGREMFLFWNIVLGV